MSEDIQLSLIPELVLESTTVSPLVTSKPVLSKPQKLKPISQGDLVETPTGDRAVVMLVNPLGDCYVEIKGEPFVYLVSDLKRIGAIISPSLTLHQIYIELHAYRTAIEQATDAEVREQLRQALAVREKFLEAAKNIFEENGSDRTTYPVQY